MRPRQGADARALGRLAQRAACARLGGRPTRSATRGTRPRPARPPACLRRRGARLPRAPARRTSSAVRVRAQSLRASSSAAQRAAVRARAGTGSTPRAAARAGMARWRTALRRRALPSAARHGPSTLLVGSWTGVRPAWAQAPSVSLRRSPRRGRSHVTPSASREIGAMARSDEGPEPRARRRRTVSAWSSMVWPRRIGAHSRRATARSAARRASRAAPSGPPRAVDRHGARRGLAPPRRRPGRRRGEPRARSPPAGRDRRSR